MKNELLLNCSFFVITMQAIIFFALSLILAASSSEPGPTPFEVEEFPLTFSTILTDFRSSKFGWNFPKDRPYHYFNSTKDIPEPFLPVKVDKIPDGDGLWIQRYKDFSGASRIFQAGTKKDTAMSVISFSSKAIPFHSVTIKALAFGKPDLKLDFHNGVSGSRYPGEEKIALLEQAKCTNTITEKGFKWIVYEVKAPQSYHINLELIIHHQNSFLILDEISLEYGPGETRTTTTAAPEDPSNENEATNERISCRVVE